jgi:hypothetical protein
MNWFCPLELVLPLVWAWELTERFQLILVLCNMLELYFHVRHLYQRFISSCPLSEPIVSKSGYSNYRDREELMSTRYSYDQVCFTEWKAIVRGSFHKGKRQHPPTLGSSRGKKCANGLGVRINIASATPMHAHCTCERDFLLVGRS